MKLFTILSVCVLCVVPLVSAQQDVCQVLACAFEDVNEEPYCYWSPLKSDKDDPSAPKWINAQLYNIEEKKSLWSALVDPPNDANQLSATQSRLHLEARNDESRAMGARAVFQSADFKSDEDFKLRFKFWQASFNTTLRLCADTSDCKTELWSSSFDLESLSKMMKENNSNKKLTHYRNWRPCVKVDESESNTVTNQCADLRKKYINVTHKGKKETIDCGVDIAEEVVVPAATTKIPNCFRNCVKNDLHHILVAGASCGIAKPPPAQNADGNNTCGGACFTLRERKVAQAMNTLTTGEPGKNWDGSLEGCKILCDIERKCQSFNFWNNTLKDGENNACTLYTDICTDNCETTSEQVFYLEILRTAPDFFECDSQVLWDIQESKPGNVTTTDGPDAETTTVDQIGSTETTTLDQIGGTETTTVDQIGGTETTTVDQISGLLSPDDNQTSEYIDIDGEKIPVQIELQFDDNNSTDTS